MIGQRVSHYRLAERLGKGGSSTVYKAHDLDDERMVAVKVFRPTGQDPKISIQSFVREARAISKIHHPNVVEIYEVVQKGDLSFLIMEFVVGESLRNRLSYGRLEIGDAARIGFELAGGLHAAHKAGVVHRDIKPDNIMVLESGRCRILDFGVAHLKDSSTLTRKGLIVGTMPYMAPEQLRSKPVDKRADVYSLGVVLFEMMTGQVPFGDTDESILFYRIMNADPPSIQSLQPKIPRDLDKIVKKAMAKKRGDRYRSASRLAQELANVLKRLDNASGAAS